LLFFSLFVVGFRGGDFFPGFLEEVSEGCRLRAWFR
jgi:hypothetical protein